MSFKRSHLFTIKRVINELITHDYTEQKNSTKRLYRTKTRNTAQNLKEVKIQDHFLKCQGKNKTIFITVMLTKNCPLNSINARFLIRWKLELF